MTDVDSEVCTVRFDPLGMQVVSESSQASFSANAAPEAESDLGAAAPEAVEKISMDSLLDCLSGTESALDLDALGLSPVFLIDTDGGVLQIYRYGGRLYYVDPILGAVCEAGCSEDALVAFLQG